MSNDILGNFALCELLPLTLNLDLIKENAALKYFAVPSRVDRSVKLSLVTCVYFMFSSYRSACWSNKYSGISC